MSNRAHLTSLRLFGALTDSCLREPYTRARFSRDLMAGASVGIIAIPLAMALAIASGVAPQHGLYTAIIAGFAIALCGGSRFSISGPTAAFVVILHPVATQFGLGGLLIATLLAGLILIGLALARLGRLIEYIPESVTLGFTSGIAIVIATLQLPDFLGLDLADSPESFLQRLGLIGSALPAFDPANTLVAVLTLATLLLWSRLRTCVPGHLPAVLIGAVAALLLAHWGLEVDTIGSRFSYTLSDGTQGQGIPPLLPEWLWPWQQPGADGQPLTWDLATLQALLPAAFTIAMLGAIESLLCAVVLDGMSGRRHNANGELLGQGIGNLLVSFFGGITATAAIARSAANYKAGAQSPVAAMIHAMVVMAGLLVLAPWMAYLPMASMAAMLLVVAWNMSEAHKVVELLRQAPLADTLVLLTCLSLTVLFDMVLAISTGIVLASLLFMRDLSTLTKVSDISHNQKLRLTNAPPAILQQWAIIKINGPLFFAAADRVFSELVPLIADKRGVVLYMDAVPMLDAGGLSALNRFLNHCRQQQRRVVIADLQFQPLRTLAKARVQPVAGELLFTPTLDEAIWLLQSEQALQPQR